MVKLYCTWYDYIFNSTTFPVVTLDNYVRDVFLIKDEHTDNRLILTWSNTGNFEARMKNGRVILTSHQVTNIIRLNENTIRYTKYRKNYTVSFVVIDGTWKCRFVGDIPYDTFITSTFEGARGRKFCQSYAVI